METAHSLHRRCARRAIDNHHREPFWGSRRGFLSPALQRFAALRLGFAIGLVCLATALPLYTSYEDRQILGRYSPAYAAVLSLVLLVAIVAIARTISRRHRREASPQAVLAQLAVATWGIAYLVAAVSDRRETGRLLDLNIVGSVSPLATALE